MFMSPAPWNVSATSGRPLVARTSSVAGPSLGGFVADVELGGGGCAVVDDDDDGVGAGAVDLVSGDEQAANAAAPSPSPMNRRRGTEYDCSETGPSTVRWDVPER